jgi:hypothetical protein
VGGRTTEDFSHASPVVPSSGLPASRDAQTNRSTDVKPDTGERPFRTGTGLRPVSPSYGFATQVQTGQSLRGCKVPCSSRPRGLIRSATCIWRRWSSTCKTWIALSPFGRGVGVPAARGDRRSELHDAPPPGARELAPPRPVLGAKSSNCSSRPQPRHTAETPAGMGAGTGGTQ